LAWFAIDKVRKNGGVLEHPKGSRFFREAGCPELGAGYDKFGGFTMLIDQFDFGHVAHKDTKLYICGIKIEDLPELPPKNYADTDRSIAGNIKGTKVIINEGYLDLSGNGLTFYHNNTGTYFIDNVFNSFFNLSSGTLIQV
jgi:hypothetical protein